jgi:hypothetical protein
MWHVSLPRAHGRSSAEIRLAYAHVIELVISCPPRLPLYLSTVGIRPFPLTFCLIEGEEDPLYFLYSP